MRTSLCLVFVFCAVVITGCEAIPEKKEIAAAPSEVSENENILLVVNFEEDTPLRYKFVCRRDIRVTWGDGDTSSDSASKNTKRYYEEVEMVFSYIPVEIKPYGLSTIRAKCESVRLKRDYGQSGRQADAIMHLKAESAELKVDPRGKIEDYSQLRKLAYKLGENAFRQNTSQGRIKEPDMIGDFLVTQWFLWDAVSSIKNPAEGVQEGQSWQSQLSVPLPIMLRAARDVTYRLAEIRQSEKGRLAVIRSSYTAADSVAGSWPLPYSGPFRISGPFGLYRNYEVLDLKGSGEQIFNIDEGRIETDRQNYTVQVKAFFPMPLGDGKKVNPHINIRQRITMEYLDSGNAEKK
ncbi:hypothetical protein ACFL1G_10475 [Planctomycetota bacterium]